MWAAGLPLMFFPLDPIGEMECTTISQDKRKSRNW